MDPRRTGYQSEQGSHEQARDESWIRSSDLTTGNSRGDSRQTSRVPVRLHGDAGSGALFYDGLYAPSGVDIMSILIRVLSRPDPRIDIGPVDMDCAMVVCDVFQQDLPVIYCSEAFEQMTGYPKDEILGRNCRFLQCRGGNPGGTSDVSRIDDEQLLELRENILCFRETQHSILNYKKGGEPFRNLLTIIPVSWDTNKVRYLVGFMADVTKNIS